MICSYDVNGSIYGVVWCCSVGYMSDVLNIYIVAVQSNLY